MPTKVSKRNLLKNNRVPFIYKWTEVSTGKWYIGSRTAEGCHPSDGYITSSTLVHSLIVSNPSDWTREILSIGVNQDEILALERQLLQSLNARMDPMSFNDTNAESNFVASTKGSVCINDGVNEKFVSSKLVDSWISLGWKRGRTESNKKAIGSTMTKRRKESPSEWTGLIGSDNSSAKSYIFTSPTGENFSVVGEFRQFCNSKGLSPNTMIKAMKEGWIPRRGVCSGWKVSNLTTGKTTYRDTENHGFAHSGESNPYYGGKKSNNK